MGGLTKLVPLGFGLLGAVSAQYFPPTPENVTVVQSQLQNGVSISYKEVRPVVNSVAVKSSANGSFVDAGVAYSQVYVRLRPVSSHTLAMSTYHLEF